MVIAAFGRETGRGKSSDFVDVIVLLNPPIFLSLRLFVSIKAIPSAEGVGVTDRPNPAGAFL